MAHEMKYTTLTINIHLSFPLPYKPDVFKSKENCTCSTNIMKYYEVLHNIVWMNCMKYNEVLYVK